jgi:predicted transcriptional regulator
MNRVLVLMISWCVFSSSAEMEPLADSELGTQSGQAGLTINARVELGDESKFVYTNTSGKALEDATVADTSYFIVDELSGAIELKGLKLDLVSDLNSSGKSALQWSLPDEIKAENFKTSGIYAASAKLEAGKVVPDDASRTFLLGIELHGTLTLPAETKLSVFVVN